MRQSKVLLLPGFTSSLKPIGMGLSSQTGISVIAAALMGPGTSEFMTMTHTIIQAALRAGTGSERG